MRIHNTGLGNRVSAATTRHNWRISPKTFSLPTPLQTECI